MHLEKGMNDWLLSMYYMCYFIVRSIIFSILFPLLPLCLTVCPAVLMGSRGPFCWHSVTLPAVLRQRCMYCWVQMQAFTYNLYLGIARSLIFFSCIWFCFGGPCPILLRDHTCWGLGDHMGSWGLNPGYLCAKQSLY